MIQFHHQPAACPTTITLPNFSSLTTVSVTYIVQLKELAIDILGELNVVRINPVRSYLSAARRCGLNMRLVIERLRVARSERLATCGIA